MLKLLILYHAGFTHIPTVLHYIDSFRRHSQHDVSYFNVDQEVGGRTDFSNYDAIWLNYCARLPSTNYDADPIALALTNYNGVKLLALQDEYHQTNKIKSEISRIGFDVVLTCVPERFIETIYPRQRFPRTRFETVLTGYIADELLHLPDIRPLAERPIVIGYRGRELPYQYGELGWHKSEIGRRFLADCKHRGIRCDIAVDEGSRILRASMV